MVEQAFSINNAWDIDPPYYVRKVDRSGHCQDAATIQNKVFCPEADDNTISVYIVASAMDLARVAIALNANRKGGSKTETLFLLAITADELAEIDVLETNGATLCNWANHLHHDLLITDAIQTSRLAEALVRAGRKHKKFTKKAMQEALDATTNDGCHAASPNSAGCVCEDELPAPQSPSWLSRLGRMLAYSMARLFGKSDRSKQ
jgi:hypothetical protein